MTDKELFKAWATHIEDTAVKWDYYKTQWGEDLGWLTGPLLNGLVYGYEYSKEERWLKHLVNQVDELFRRLKEERGHPGWGHSITGEGVVLEPVLYFIELSQHDPDMPAEYKSKAREYLKLIDTKLLPKWDRMGYWENTHLQCGTFKTGITLPHNKNAHVGLMFLWGARVTPSDKKRKNYLDKCARLARRWHKFLKVKQDRYIWHYWDAGGPWDYDETGKSRHWTSLEHRGYGSADVHFAALAYDFGLVLDKKDMEMHCNAFLKEIWNGDKKTPYYKAMGTFNPEYKESTIFTGLARFNKVILDLWGQEMQKDPTAWGALAGVPKYLLVKKRGLGFGQKYAAWTKKYLTKEQRSKLSVGK